jgi:hypothetical protein
MRNVIDETKWNTETDFFRRRALREAETERFFSTYPNVPNGDVRSYSDWLVEQTRAGLPTDIDPPSGVESHDAWRTRMIGTSDSLPATQFASHAPYRGSSERDQRARALMGLNEPVPPLPIGPTRRKKESLVTRALRFARNLVP